MLKKLLSYQQSWDDKAKLLKLLTKISCHYLFSTL